MQIHLTITRGEKKEELRLEIPTGWPQVTFEQYLKYFTFQGDMIKAVALFTGLDEQMVRDAEIHNLGAVAACLHFLNTPLDYLLPLTIEGYPIPKDLDGESIAQYADLQTITGLFKDDDPTGNYQHFPLIVATYCIKPYDFIQAEKLAPTFLKSPCTEVLAIGNFTLVRLYALRSGTLPTSPPVATPLNKLRLGMINWLKTLASTIRYNSWKRSLPTSERNFLNGRSRSSSII